MEHFLPLYVYRSTIQFVLGHDRPTVIGMPGLIEKVFRRGCYDISRGELDYKPYANAYPTNVRTNSLYDTSSLKSGRLSGKIKFADHLPVPEESMPIAATFP